MNSNFLIELNTYLEQIILERQKALSNFECINIYQNDNAFDLFNKAKEYTDNEVDVTFFIKKEYKEKFANFILQKEILKYCVFWANLGIKNKSDLIYKLSLYVYLCFLYPYLFKKMLPFCDNINLQIKINILKNRKNSYISKTSSHFEIIDSIVKNRLSKKDVFKFSAMDIYNEFIITTNLIRQIIRSIVNTYINKNIKIDHSQYINKENLIFQIYNSLAIVDVELLQKVSEDRHISFKQLENKIKILQQTAEKFFKHLENKLNNPIFLKINNLKSVYWSQKFGENILKEFAIFSKTNIKELYCIAEYFRRYILRYI